MLSPFNKRPGEGREDYLRKRRLILQSEVHLVELDLLRDGERVPMGKPLPPADYYAIISRSTKDRWLKFTHGQSVNLCRPSQSR